MVSLLHLVEIVDDWRDKWPSPDCVSIFLPTRLCCHPPDEIWDKLDPQRTAISNHLEEIYVPNDEFIQWAIDLGIEFKILSWEYAGSDILLPNREHVTTIMLAWNLCSGHLNFQS